MFGYTVPLYSRMSHTDLSLYRKYYCETCHQLRTEFGLVSTAAVNYDMTFNTIVLNSVTGDVLDFEGTGRSPFCVFMKSKADSDLMRQMAAYTVLLTKWELVDDTTDKPSMKSNAASLMLGRAIAKAERMYSEYDDAVGKGFEELRSLEKEGCTDPIRIGTEFGKALAHPLNIIAGNSMNEHLTDLFIHLTSAIYIMDAVDDLDQDYMDDTFNPFLSDRDGYVNKKEFISANLYKITSSLNTVIGSLQKSYSSVRPAMKSCIGITDNIVYKGLPDSAKKVIMGESLATASIKNSFERHKKRNVSG